MTLAAFKRTVQPGMRFRVEHHTWPEKSGWATVTTVSSAGIHHRRDDHKDDYDWYTDYPRAADATIEGRSLTYSFRDGAIRFTYHFE